VALLLFGPFATRTFECSRVLIEICVNTIIFWWPAYAANDLPVEPRFNACQPSREIKYLICLIFIFILRAFRPLLGDRALCLSAPCWHDWAIIDKQCKFYSSSKQNWTHCKQLNDYAARKGIVKTLIGCWPAGQLLLSHLLSLINLRMYMYSFGIVKEFVLSLS